MEGWLSLCLMALAMLMALCFLRLSGYKNNPKKRLPPGPWTLPIIGSLHHLIGALPHRTLTALSRRHGPLMLLRLGEVQTVVVSSAEAVALVMKTNDLTFSSRPSIPTMDILTCGGKGFAFAPYGDHWRQMRKVCIVELLSSKQVKRMEGIRAELVGGLIRHITHTAASATGGAAGGAIINVSEKVTRLSNDVVSRAVLGGKFAQQGEYIRTLYDALALLGGFHLIDFFPSWRLVRWLSNEERNMKKRYGRVQHIIADIVEARREATKAAGGGGGASCGSTNDDDMLDVLLRLQQEDTLSFPLTSEIIGAVLFDILGAATETTGILLVWAMSELARHPEAMAKAQLEVRKVLGEDHRAVITNSDLAELHYVRMVIKEVLRLHPPNPIILRMNREDCKIMDYDIPKGTSVYVNIFAVSRDPEHWENPERFRPERFENSKMDYTGTYSEFTPFGTGRRQCPGIQFSSSLAELALANFLYHFDWMLPDGETPASFDMSEKFTFTVSRRYDLHLRAIPHVCLKSMPSK
ncbi:ent-isokaurene C2-hydroxylase isoform X1 [Brachypodium distachyon]|uniref:Cytochrome P450 n=1 Tax=Brachypodium distachyon TaxID=15368 RepID=I1J1P1_BRADI|nr:ent-isokaurene C2-hydroxylase isoform X1 [Brachypodium distachyon]PNT61827.1 hypothetical protein BRADI_5g21410v3 [Brachypodium distachyon]|eukprot:XP_010240405.1 ent-isokaurene C2-hydroxylase isoform X1 [Brachypodium distachyon]